MLTFGLLPSCVKKLCYRIQGNKIGRHVKLHLGAVVQSKEKFCIGDNTELGFFTSVMGNIVQIGKRCNLHSAVVINVPKVIIGNDVTISDSLCTKGSFTSLQMFLLLF